MTLVLIHEQEPTLKPYKFYPERGDCADGLPTDVSKRAYGEEFAFRFVGRLKIKHAD